MRIVRWSVRSTKAGGRTPATPPWIAEKLPREALAQRRPGVEPRRRVDELRSAADAAARSTKAGGRTPATQEVVARARRSCLLAQRRPGVEPRRRLEELDRKANHFRRRSTKAGGRTPATREVAAASAAFLGIAQRRPGVEPRRRSLACIVTIPRSVLAQRRPGVEPRRRTRRVFRVHLIAARSTKAGGRTPATPPISQPGHLLRGPLNEGRGSNPGDACRPSQEGYPTPRTLNEGRGSNPGDAANPVRESLPEKIAQICGHQIPCSHAD